jgi:hypothetical protein
MPCMNLGYPTCVRTITVDAGTIPDYRRWQFLASSLSSAFLQERYL